MPENPKFLTQDQYHFVLMHTQLRMIQTLTVPIYILFLVNLKIILTNQQQLF